MDFVNFVVLISVYFFLCKYKAAPMLPPLSPGQNGTYIFLKILHSASLPFAKEFNAQPPERTRFSFLFL